MADLITRLKVDSTEYDAKIKRAAQGLQHYVQSAHDSGDVIGRLLGNTKKYVESLGNMATVSTTARGRLNELTAAFTDLRSVYNSLSEEEKSAKGGFGQELNKQLEILKGRINDTKNELKGIDQELGNTKQAEDGAKSGLEGLTSALGINVKSLAGWGAALTAGKVALDVAKDAFFASETNVDEWGRTVRSAEGIYQSFVQSLNTGDFTGFLNNIGRVTQAAQEAYNALDELGTRMTIINPERARLQARQQELRADIRRNGADSEVGKAALAELKKIEPLLSKSFKTESQMNYTAFEKLVRERLAEGGINLNQRSFEQFMKTFSSDAAFQNLRRNARGSSELRETSEIGKFRTVDTRNIEQKLLDLFTDEWRQANSGYLTSSFSAQGAAASNALGNARYMRAGSGGGKGGKSGKTNIQFADDSIMAQEKLVQELTQKWKTASGEVRDGYLKQLEEAQQKLSEMTGKAKGLDLDKLFPDMSKANFNTGYAGSSQAKYDSAMADLALGPMNLDAVNTYIGSIKGILKEANLGDELYTSMTEKLKDATTVSTLLQEMMERGLAGADLESTAQALKEKLLSPDGIDQTAIQSFLDTLNAQIEEAGGVKMMLNTDTGEVTDDKGKGKDDGEELKKFNEGVGKLTGGLSSVTSGLKAVGVEIPKEVDQVIGVINGVSQIISGIGTIISLFSTTAMTANTTAVGLNTAAIGGLIAALEFNTATNFIPFFANGGIVPHAANGYFVGGNSFSGDKTPIMANAGELVLSKSQQGVLASMLTDEERGGGNAQPYLDGEKIYLGLQAYMRRSGLGEIVTSER